jgi:hypothetical protein
MPRRGFPFLLLVVLACGGPAGASAAESARPRAPLRVLFIGNSLTSANDLPGMVAGLSRAARDEPPLEVETVAFGGFSLADHLAEGSAVRAIERGGWDVVVLQQGPSTRPESRDDLVVSARRFARTIRAHSARPALYGVWPEEARRAAFPAGIASYRAAADAVDGLMFPVALAWEAAWRIDPAFPLYGPDRFHPSPLGTYLATVVIYAGLRGRSPSGLPDTFATEDGTVTIPRGQARLAQNAALDARPRTEKGSR